MGRYYYKSAKPSCRYFSRGLLDSIQHQGHNEQVKVYFTPALAAFFKTLLGLPSMSLPVRELRLILGDQLNAQHPWFRDKRADVLYVIAEVLEETHYVKHHIQKVCGFFLAMQKFAAALSQAGHRVMHLTLDDTHTHAHFPALLDHLIAQLQPTIVSYQQPDEYRLQASLRAWSNRSKLTTHCVDSAHFLMPLAELQEWLPKDKTWRMEFFYRRMRQHHNVLMENGKPTGGEWNYDKENRQPLGKRTQVPKPMLFAHDVSAIIERLSRHQVTTFGRLANQTLIWPVTRREAKNLLRYFIDYLLPSFGTYQDAMSQQEWSLFHSRLSFSLNTKMLHPMEVIRAVETAYHEQQTLSIAQAEGFIRQILGWREYVRGVYWQLMPGYDQTNFLAAERPLPNYFWSGNTRMACMKKAITQSLDYAYAHHIQRLMITGNFCLLAGINPTEVHAWYLGVYMDAIEWVELPNTLGMSQFADGGKLASKPYSAGGNYIHKMSDHCGHCHYNVKAKHGEGCCPFNVLYWDFLDRHRDKLGENHRLAMIYRNWDKRLLEDRNAILNTAQGYLNNLDSL